MNRFVLAALVALAPGLSMAQTVDRNPAIQVKTQPPGTANNTAASTAFVAASLAAGTIQTGGAITGAIQLTPSGSPSTVSIHNPSGSAQPQGTFLSGSGTYLDFCSIGGCADGPYMMGSNVINTTTRLGAGAQEVGLHVNFDSNTGKVTQWAPNTSYATGVEVYNPGTTCNYTVGGTPLTTGSCIYRATTGGTSAASGGPGGNGASITDGSVVWAYQSAVGNGKSALSIAANFGANSAAGWGFVFDVSTGAGTVGPIYGEEKDCNNGTKDASAGEMIWVCSFYGGGSAGSFPLFSSIYSGSGAVNSGNPNPYGAHYGWYISGNPGDTGSVYKDGVIGDYGNSTYTVQAAAGRTHSAFLRDDSNSTTVLSATGTHFTGIDLSTATISGGVALKAPASTFLDWADAGFLGFNGSLGAFTLGGTTSGTAYSLGVYNSGDVLVGRHLGQRGGSKPNLTGCGASTLTAASTDVSGIINIETGITACGLNFGAAYSTEADCVFSGSGGVPPAWGNSTSGYALAFSAAPAGLKISYVCMGQ